MYGLIQLLEIAPNSFAFRDNCGHIIAVEEDPARKNLNCAEDLSRIVKNMKTAL